MLIKKSAILLVVIAACSLSLLIFSSARTLPVTKPETNSKPLKCSCQTEDNKAFSPWEMLTQMVFHSAA